MLGLRLALGLVVLLSLLAPRTAAAWRVEAEAVPSIQWVEGLGGLSGVPGPIFAEQGKEQLAFWSFETSEIWILGTTPPRRLVAASERGLQGPRRIDLADSSWLLTDRRGMWLLSRDGEVRPFSPPLRPAAGGATLTANALVRIERPVVPAAGEEPRWEDRAWRRARLRPDCLAAFRAGAGDAPPKPVLCSPDFDGPALRILPGGFVAYSPETGRFAVAMEALPLVAILDPVGEILARRRWLAADRWPELTADDERAQLQGPEQAMALRNRIPWVVGLVSWPRGAGIVSRVVTGNDGDAAGGSVRWRLDLVSWDGELLASALEIPLPPSGPDDMITAVDLGGGAAGVVLTRRSGREVRSRTLYRLSFEPPVEPVAPRDNEAVVVLTDARSGSPVRRVRFVLQAGGVMRHLEPESADGRYRLDVDEPTEVLLQSPGYRAPAALTLHPEEELHLALDPGAVVRGLVLHDATGEPVASAEVSRLRHHPRGSLVAERFGHVDAVRTDEDGLFRLSGLDTEPFCLRIRAEGLAPLVLPLPGMPTGSERDLGAIFASAGARLRGRVVDEGGRGVSQARVELRAGPAGSPCLRREAEMAEDGSFTMDGVGPGRWSLVVRWKSQVVTTRSVEGNAGEGNKSEGDVGEIVLRRRSLRGRITRDGVPAESGLLTLAPRRSAGLALPPVFLARRDGRQEAISDVPNRLAARVEEDGTFEALGFLPEADLVVTWEPGDGTSLSRRVRLPAPEGDAEIALDFSGQELTVQVLDPGGKPVEAARVEALRDGLTVRAGNTGPDGLLRVPALPTGRFLIRATEDGRSSEVESELPRSSRAPLEVRLADESAALRIFLPPNLEMVATIIALDHDRNAHHVLRVSAPRSFPLSPGSYTLLAALDGVLLPPTRIDLPAGREASQSYGSLEVARPRIDLGEAFAGRTARLLSEAEAMDALLQALGVILRVDETGRLHLPPLAAGEWKLLIEGEAIPISFRADPDRPILDFDS